MLWIVAAAAAVVVVAATLGVWLAWIERAAPWISFGASSSPSPASSTSPTRPQEQPVTEAEADAWERGYDAGVDHVIEAVRDVLTPQQRHTVEQIISKVLAHPGAETPPELLTRRDEFDDA